MKFRRIFIFALLVATTMLLAACGGKKAKVGPAVINNTGQKDVTLRLGMSFDALAGISATDAVAKDVTDKIQIEGTVDTNVAGTYHLTYKVTGTDGVEFVYERDITVAAVVINGLEDRKVSQGSTVNLTSGVTVVDPILGTLYAHNAEHLEKYFTITGEVNKDVAGDYEVVYVITIEDFTTTIVRTFHVVKEATINVPGGGEEEQLEYGSNFDPKLNVSAVMPIEWEKPLQATDENGEPIVDAQGKPVYVQEEDEEGNPVFDEEGNPVYVKELDDDGNPIIVYGTRAVDAENIAVIGSVNTQKTGTYTLTYKIIDPENPLEYLKDGEGNDVVATRTIKVYIKVEIRGLAPLTVTIDSEFSNMVQGMEGVTGYDTIKGNVTSDIQVIGEVNVGRLGEYTLTYLLVGSEGVTDQKTRKVTVVPPIAGLQEIVFMSGSVTEHDPFHPGFTGTEAERRQELHIAAEETFNVKITYKQYPDNAAWGNDRISAIIQASTAGTPLADVFYHVTTDWLGQLAGGGGIAPINNYLGEGKPGEKINQKIIDAGTMGENSYGFSTGELTVASGLYFNVDLLNELGIPNPAELYYNEGVDVGAKWRWSDFKAWAMAAQAQLNTKGEDYYALGGALAYYGENMVPLNGGSYLDLRTGTVHFADEPAMQTYDFIRELFVENLFEPNRSYDQGSAEWQAGKVLMHPGDLWFVKAPNRWGNLGFELGFVPYPMSDTYEGEYLSPIYGTSVAYLAAGHSAERRELAFKVWNAVQIWETEGITPEEGFRDTLMTRFEDELYVDAYMTIYDKAYVEFLNSIGVGAYSPNSLKLTLNAGIRDGELRSAVESIVGIYETMLGQFIAGN